MATKYDDIIKLRGGKASYNIENEKEGEWVSFIPNEQFNNVLRTVLKSVRGNDIDNHKSFLDKRNVWNGEKPCCGCNQPLVGR